MKIEITNEDMSGCSDCLIYSDNKRIMNIKNSFPRQYQFSDDDISMILTPPQYEKYLNGQYLFDVPAWIINTISGNIKPTMRTTKFFTEYESY